jgi:hypothetical protein
MSNLPATPPATRGPWLLLIQDRDQADPKLILATVASPRDVRPARPGVEGLDEIPARYLAASHGVEGAEFTPMRGALVWRVDEGGR